MPALFEYSNVYASALQILKEKGYQLWFDSSENIFWAERDGWDFASESPCGLLGLVALYEYRAPTEYKEYWWRTEGIDTRDLPREPQPYASALVVRQPKR